MKTRPFDGADHLDNPKVIAAYLSEAFESGDPRLVKLAFGAVGNPGLDTVMRDLNAMGVRLEARAKPRHERMPPQRERMHV